ncbi:MAG: DUF4150 domain-containing protein [Planctomycetota bacterium]
MLPAKTQMMGMNMAFPDVCRTPVGPAPVPIPYPNIAMPMMGIPGTTAVKTLTLCMPNHVMGTNVPLSNGDNAGVAGGMVSQMMMGPSTDTLGSTGIIVEGRPATYMGSMSAQNGMGAANSPPGFAIVPSQIKLLIRP